MLVVVLAAEGGVGVVRGGAGDCDSWVSGSDGSTFFLLRSSLSNFRLMLLPTHVNTCDFARAMVGW
jgi:hypothetical protein